jgi:hypothetical protein
MAYTASEQALYDHARQSLPRFLFQSDSSPEELWGAYVKIFDAARTQTVDWLAQAYIKTATGVWLDQHARDRGTNRQLSETDAALRSRLVSVQDAVTYPALLARAQGIATAGGVPSPLVAMVELRRDKAYVNTGGVGESMAFLERGYRVGGDSRPMIVIAILPYGTTAATGASVAEYLRLTKGAGYSVKVEIRTIP